MQAVKRLRKRRGWTIEELAKASGISHFTVSEIELGKRNPHGKTLKKIADALDVEVADLFDDEASIPKEQAPPEVAPAAAGNKPEVQPATLNEAPGRLELLEAHTAGIMEMVGELDPEHEALDRVAVALLKVRLSEIGRAIAKKESQKEKWSEVADNPLANVMKETLDTAGETTEIYGVGTDSLAKIQFGRIPVESEPEKRVDR